MVRRTSLWLPVLIAGALGALFCACSGSDQTGLFSPSGGMTCNAGASANAGGPSATGGHAATGGSSSAAGSTNAAGSSASGGNSDSGGATGTGGAQSGGSANGGAGNGGAVSGGAGNNGGSANGGNNNAGTAGASTAGSNNGGASGTGGAVGTGGAAGNPTCQDLIATAAQQLDAASVCNSSGNAEQCTGSVSATCGCMVPVESDDSPETKAYLATLASIQEKHCIQACPAIACVLGHAECKSQGGSSSACVAAPLTPVN
jgi:hypothetical protein